MQVELSGCNFSFSARSDLPNRSESIQTILDQPNTIPETISELWNSQNGDSRDRDFCPFCAWKPRKRYWMDHLPGEHTSQKKSRLFGTQPPPKKFCGVGTRVHAPQLMRQTATQNLRDFTTQLDPSVRSPVRRKRLRRDNFDSVGNILNAR